LSFLFPYWFAPTAGTVFPFTTLYFKCNSFQEIMHLTTAAVLAGLLSGTSALVSSPFEHYGVSHSVQKRQASSTFPKVAGTSSLTKPMEVSGTFDGGMVRFDRGSRLRSWCMNHLGLTFAVQCDGQTEGGNSDAVFLVQSGGVLKNVIIGANQREGIHCLGPCTIENVWWEAVCEDALTIKQNSGTSYVVGGGAKGALDKVIQHNGGGTVNIQDFYVPGFGKLYRSCGNCKTQFERHVVVDGALAEDGSVLIGINTNYGDSATIRNTCARRVKTICQEFTGNDSGAEPTKLRSGPSDVCIYSDADVSAC
jgi:hypothetical protein